MVSCGLTGSEKPLVTEGSEITAEYLGHLQSPRQADKYLSKMYADTILLLEGIFFVFLLVCMASVIESKPASTLGSALPLSDTPTRSVSLVPQTGLEFTLESKAWFLLFSCLTFSGITGLCHQP